MYVAIKSIAQRGPDDPKLGPRSDWHPKKYEERLFTSKRCSLFSTE